MSPRAGSRRTTVQSRTAEVRAAPAAISWMRSWRKPPCRRLLFSART